MVQRVYNKKSFNSTDDPLIKRFLPKFFKGLQKSVKDLESATKKHDFDKISFLGHKIKGSSGIFGFPILFRIAELIEEFAKSKDEGNVKHFIGVYSYHLERLEREHA
jgi:HPt (histidine-containing phosphotransfer) domain-containing protein